ncbi:MAG: EamA family transporter, partial [Candidatus Eisenbacteria bacterium]|nr:EamA family transporter [Candidatus Eisenbacteria bacterium]
MNFSIAGAVCSSVLFGAADLVGGLAARRDRAMRVTFFSGLGAIAVLLVALPFSHGTPTQSDYLWALAAGVCGAAGATLIYKSFALGPVSLASPVLCTLGLIVPVVVGLFSGERPSLAQWLGIAVGLGALPLLSLANEGSAGHTRAHLMKTLYVASLAGLVVGWFLVCVARIGPHAGLLPLVAARAAAMAILALLLIAGRHSLMPARAARGWSLGAGARLTSAE